LTGRRTAPRPRLARLGLLLAPGAGAGRDQPALVAIDREASAAGAEVVRMDFPYRKAGRRSPDRPPVLLAAVAEEAASLAERATKLVLGGRSMGGRMCSMAVADGLQAAGLVLISYPLHPPGRPDRLRDEHFPSIKVPCLFVSGTRDQFGSPEELEAATAAIRGPVTHRWFDSKDHALRGVDDHVARLVVDWLAEHGLVGRGGASLR
jgi:predicted alpha/beta-hydrolase family hydrolase